MAERTQIRVLPGRPGMPYQSECSMKFMFKKQSIMILSLCVLVACAGASPDDDEGSYADAPRGSDCISKGTIRDYRVLDDSNLVVTAAGKRRYHVALSRRAIGLRSSIQIGFISSTGQICSSFSQLLVDDGFGPERIRIASIRQLSTAEYDSLLVRFGKKEPEIKQAPAQQSVESAEVEELD